MDLICTIDRAAIYILRATLETHYLSDFTGCRLPLVASNHKRLAVKTNWSMLPLIHLYRSRSQVHRLRVIVLPKPTTPITPNQDVLSDFTGVPAEIVKRLRIPKVYLDVTMEITEVQVEIVKKSNNTRRHK